MASEKLKEVREWLTFALSFVTVIAIPVGVLILHNQRQEMIIEGDARWLKADAFNQASGRWDTGLGELRGSLNAVLIQQTRQSDAIENLKERFDASARRGAQ